MKEKIDQLENLLNEITQVIEKRLKIEAITIEEYDDLICELEEDYFTIHSEEKEIFNTMKVHLIEDLISEKKTVHFFDNDIPRLKSLLSDRLSKLIDTNNNLVGETRFGSRLKGPNNDFKKILEHALLTTETRIFGNFDRILHEGYLTKEGYFKLLLDTQKTKLFSSLSTAASFICNKPILKGWQVWFALDKNGEEQKLEYFRKSIVD